ncbi:MAG TPA: AI-2E family transporter [Bradyrhizobium sp.]|nr:AI-2E family transporter [Bradyrhizobium sp.]
MDLDERQTRALRPEQSGDAVIHTAIRLVLLALLVYWSFVLLRPFLPILIWSIVLAVALYPFFDWLSSHLGHRPRLAAILTTLIVLAVFLGPATWLGIGLVDGLKDISDQLTSGDLVLPTPPQSVRDWPLVGEQLYELWSQASSNLEATFRQVAPHLKPLAGPILAIARSAGTGTIKFILAVILTGFLFSPGPRLVATIRNMLARIVAERSKDFVALAGATIRTVAQGVIGVAVLQALLAGIGMKIAGVPNAGLLAFGILVLGIVQIGSAPILLPVIIWIWIVKDVGAALLITIYLTLVGVSDNVLRPMLMGRGLSTPALVIFIGVLGGTLALGIVGLFVGPIVLAVAWELLMAWSREEAAVAVPAPSGAEVIKSQP